MRKNHLSITLARGMCLVALLGFTGDLRAGGVGGGSFETNQIVVHLDPGGDISTINEMYGTGILASIVEESLYLLSLPDGISEETMLLILQALEFVDWVELNIPITTMDGTTGSFFVNVTEQDYLDQYALDLVNPASTETSMGVRVAVLDTGVDASHPLLGGRLAAGGFDFIDMDSDPADVGNGVDDDADGFIDELVGHGTHIAGLVAIIAPNAEILPVRVLNSDGVGYSFQAAQGIYHAINNGARVINLSFASPIQTNVLTAALTSAQQASVVVVTAAGNHDQESPVQYPAGDPSTIAVAATDVDDLKSSFSNHGVHITIAAPGDAIVSTLPGGLFGSADGTSFSAALVSGAAALLVAQTSGASPVQITQALTAGAGPLNAANTFLLGAGRLDITAALAQGDVTPCAPGDLDGNGVVGMTDFLMLLAAWGPNPGHPADLDGDGVVAIADFLALLSDWGPCP